MILLLDNFDSFTYNLVDYFQQAGQEVFVIRNDINPSIYKHKDFNAVILSAGPETPEKAGYLLDVLDYYHNKLPILGVCLGHQAIGKYFGAGIIKALRPMHGKISRIQTIQEGIFEGLPSEIDVVRYNSLVITQVQSPLKIIAYSRELEIMAIQHSQLPICGVQFHPEAVMTGYGLRMIRNWLEYNSIEV